MAYFFYDDNPDIVVALKRESKRIPYQYDRVVWSKKEKRFIYGDPEEYVVYVTPEDKQGEECDLSTFEDCNDCIPKLDTSIRIQNIIKDSYRTGLTQCGSSFYDDGTRLYEVVDVGDEHKLIFEQFVLEMYHLVFAECCYVCYKPGSSPCVMWWDLKSRCPCLCPDSDTY